MGDTSPRAEQRYLELRRAQPPEQRLRQVVLLTQTVRKLALAGLRERHPEASEFELRTRLTVRLYGREVAERLFGDVPADAL